MKILYTGKAGDIEKTNTAETVTEIRHQIFQYDKQTRKILQRERYQTTKNTTLSVQDVEKFILVKQAVASVQGWKSTAQNLVNRCTP